MTSSRRDLLRGCAVCAVLASAGPTRAWPPSFVADSSTANVYRSTDQGATWQNMGQYRGAAPGANVYVSMTLNSSNHLFVAETWTNGSTEDFEVYKSTDQGGTWAPTNPPLPADVTTGAHYYEPAITTDVNNRLLLVLLVGPYCQGTTVNDRPRSYRSTDGGASWTYVGITSSGPWTPYPGWQTTPVANNGFACAASTLSGSTLIGCADTLNATCATGWFGGFVTWDYGTTMGYWSGGSYARALAVDPYNNVYRFGGSISGSPQVTVSRYAGGGFGGSTSLGQAPLNGAYPLAAAADNLGVVYCASAATGLVYKSLDMGGNWTAAGSFSGTAWSTASIAMAGDIALLPPGAATPTPTPAVSLAVGKIAPNEGALRAHPNPRRPFSGPLTFSFRPAERAVVALFTLAGERIVTLPPQDVDAAAGTARWSGRNERGGVVLAGAYLAVLLTERGRETAGFALARE